MTTEDLLDFGQSGGAYAFIPEWRNPLPKSFGILDSNVEHQRGKMAQQWTIRFNKPVTPAGPEQGIIRVRQEFNQPELIRFDVELNQVPIGDRIGKDLTVNWKMYDDFDAKGVFYTDSNGMQMVNR